jgi:hypothetical protein
MPSQSGLALGPSHWALTGGGVSLACWAQATPKAADNMRAEASDNFAIEFIFVSIGFIDAHKTLEGHFSVAAFRICNSDG